MNQNARQGDWLLNMALDTVDQTNGKVPVPVLVESVSRRHRAVLNSVRCLLQQRGEFPPVPGAIRIWSFLRKTVSSEDVIVPVELVDVCWSSTIVGSRQLLSRRRCALHASSESERQWQTAVERLV
jgi:hypothetical protein